MTVVREKNGAESPDIMSRLEVGLQDDRDSIPEDIAWGPGIPQGTTSHLSRTSICFAGTAIGKCSCNHLPASGVEVKTYLSSTSS
jgi:hypothetical protein